MQTWYVNGSVSKLVPGLTPVLFLVCPRSLLASLVCQRFVFFKTRFQIKSGYVLGLSTVVACKLGLSTVGVIQQLLFRLTHSGSVCRLSTVVACKLGLSTVSVVKNSLQVNVGSVCRLQRSLLANWVC